MRVKKHQIVKSSVIGAGAKIHFDATKSRERPFCCRCRNGGMVMYIRTSLSTSEKIYLAPLGRWLTFHRSFGNICNCLSSFLMFRYLGKILCGQKLLLPPHDKMFGGGRPHASAASGHTRYDARTVSFQDI